MPFEKSRTAGKAEEMTNPEVCDPSFPKGRLHEVEEMIQLNS
jgi:hypothetical protein